MRLALAALVMLVAGDASAHTRSVSYSSWELTETDIWVRVRIPTLELTRLGRETLRAPGDPDPLAHYLSEHLLLRAGDAPCAPTQVAGRLSSSRDAVVYQWRVRCPDTTAASRTLESALFRDVAPSHLHFARARAADGSLRERVLSETEPSWELESSERGSIPDTTPLAGYVMFGVEHILTGWDHLAFVLGLLLLAKTLRDVATFVTAFTVAHTMTLALAALDVVHPEPAVVEALIGFSIALVAAEKAWLLSGRDPLIPGAATGALLALAVAAAWGAGALTPATMLGLALFTGCHFALLARAARPELLHSAIAFGFGLVHGLGFAGVMDGIELPRARVVTVLFGFNAGVELGQLALVWLSWPALALLRRLAAERHRLVVHAASAAACGLGLYWFVTRTWG